MISPSNPHTGALTHNPWPALPTSFLTPTSIYLLAAVDGTVSQPQPPLYFFPTSLLSYSHSTLFTYGYIAIYIMVWHSTFSRAPPSELCKETFLLSSRENPYYMLVIDVDVLWLHAIAKNRKGKRVEKGWSSVLIVGDDGREVSRSCGTRWSVVDRGA